MISLRLVADSPLEEISPSGDVDLQVVGEAGVHSEILDLFLLVLHLEELALIASENSVFPIRC